MVLQKFSFFSSFGFGGSLWRNHSLLHQNIGPSFIITNIKGIVFYISPLASLLRCGFIPFIVVSWLFLLFSPTMFVEVGDGIGRCLSILHWHKTLAKLLIYQHLWNSCSKVLHCVPLKNRAPGLVFMVQIFTSSLMAEISFIWDDRLLNFFTYATNYSLVSLLHCCKCLFFIVISINWKYAMNYSTSSSHLVHCLWEMLGIAVA